MKEQKNQNAQRAQNAKMPEIGKISPATGIITEYDVPVSTQLNGITAGPDGNLWFVDG